MVVKRIAPMSVGKILGVMYAVIGLIIGVLFAAIAALGMGSGSSPDGTNPLAFLGGMGIAAVIVLPIFYGICGFIGGLIMAALYNVFAGMVGGIEVDMA